MIGLSKVFVLDFRAQVETRFRTRDAELKTKNMLNNVKYVNVKNMFIYFNFDEKLTQSVAQTTMSYHVSKDIRRLYFAVDQVLSISGYHLENGRMPCKHKY